MTIQPIQHGTADDTRAELFLRDWRSLSRIGQTPGGGVERQAASVADAQSRTWFTTLLNQYGFTVRTDVIGNIWGLLEWNPGAPFVVVGSHLDSQPLAGKFDGAYGVAAALHAGRRLAEEGDAANRPKYNLAVVDWFNEEGSRFTPSMMGSSVYTGKLPAPVALATEDADGVTVAEALSAVGGTGSWTGPAPAAAAEIHIEQGRSLEDSGTTIGLVESCWAAEKFTVVVRGEQAHTGSTVIADRHDALLGASRLVVLLRELADRFPGGALHTSVGQLTVVPNSPVVVPRRVDLTMDLRSADEGVLAEAKQLLEQGVKRIEQEAAVTVEISGSHAWGVRPYASAGVDLARECADALGLRSKPVQTLAGHDSINMNDVVPTVMLFVPSREGISHHEGEYTEDTDLCAGVDVLTEVVRRLCRGELDDGR
ncbi:M20 family metallo-hydrolase [Streptomyces sp. NPDC005962]|uniref:M20 family metallo-hydrolase n=1 Tax=Streptomyces sp. NPDC005962 TaxID=3154466 RepID=UPI0033FC1F13